MKVVYSKKSQEFYLPGHPESPQRIKLIYKELSKNNHYVFIEPKPSAEKDLQLAHSKKLIKAVQNNDFIDPDTPQLPNIFEYASLSASGAILASEIALKERLCFSLMRPPGHHAEKNKLGGFCYFNNIAVAVKKLVKKNLKVGILDIDAHHGNGTEDIVKGGKNLLFCSIHQSPLYPGTGLKSEKNCFNFPLAPSSKWPQYKLSLEKALSLLQKFKPDIIGVSLGFDTYKKDPLSNLELEIKDFFQIGKYIFNLNLPTFFVLEGGYSEDIGLCSQQFFSSINY